MLKVLIVDDHPITVDGTVIILNNYFGKDVSISSADTKNAALYKLKKGFDIVISDIMIPEKKGKKAQEFVGIDLAEYIKKHYTGTKLIVLTMLRDVRMLRKLVEIGVNSIISKSMDEKILIEAVKSVISGKDFFDKELKESIFLNEGQKEKINIVYSIVLSPYEEKVLEYTAHGLTEKEIAKKIEKSTRTVERHIKSLKIKLDAGNKENMVYKATKLGLV